MEWLLYIILVLIGYSICLFVSVYNINKNRKRDTVGKLKVDTTDPDGPYIFAEFSKDVGEIFSKEYVILEIDRTNISHD